MSKSTNKRTESKKLAAASDSLHSKEKIAPSNSGIKHLDRESVQRERAIAAELERNLRQPPLHRLQSRTERASTVEIVVA